MLHAEQQLFCSHCPVHWILFGLFSPESSAPEQCLHMADDTSASIDFG